MNNEELKDYTVLADSISIEGIEYLKDQTVSLTDDQAESLLADGSIAFKEVEAVENDQAADQEQAQASESSSVNTEAPATVKYKVVVETGVYSNFDNQDHAQGEVIELDPNNEQTINFVEGGLVQEVTE